MPDAITGIIPATLTPFRADGAICHDTVRRHIDFLAEGGLTAVAPAGTTGEFLYLSTSEKAELIQSSVRAATGRLKVIAGIWALDPRKVGQLARSAEDAGADAVFLTTPIYYPATDDAVLAWYRSARQHTALPLYAYSIPQYAMNTVTTAALQRLIEDGTIQGIKDSTGKAERVQELLDTAAGRVAVYGASDSFALKARNMGCTGFISALANIFPATFARIWKGDVVAQAAIDQVRTAVKGYGGISALKALLRARGLDFGGTRLPFANVTVEEEASLRELMDSLPELS